MRRKKNNGNSLTFAEQVYKATAQIPRGRVATYAWIARKIKNPRSVRAVGNALNKNPYAPQVPCHRVVRSDGMLGGFASGTRTKKRMLEREGLIIANDRVEKKCILR